MTGIKIASWNQYSYGRARICFDSFCGISNVAIIHRPQLLSFKLAIKWNWESGHLKWIVQDIFLCTSRKKHLDEYTMCQISDKSHLCHRSMIHHLRGFWWKILPKMSINNHVFMSHSIYITLLLWPCERIFWPRFWALRWWNVPSVLRYCQRGWTRTNTFWLWTSKVETFGPVEDILKTALETVVILIASVESNHFES